MRVVIQAETLPLDLLQLSAEERATCVHDEVTHSKLVYSIWSISTVTAALVSRWCTADLRLRQVRIPAHRDAVAGLPYQEPRGPTHLVVVTFLHSSLTY